IGAPLPHPRLPSGSEVATMTISDESRYHLYLRLEEVLGPEDARALMEQLPPGGWAELATKRDRDALGLSTKRDLEGLGAATNRDIDALGLSTKRDMEALGLSTRRDIDALGLSTKRDMEAW